MIEVINESESYDSEELKFDTLEDVLNYINDDSLIDKWNEDNTEVYIRSLNDDGSMYTISIGLSDYLNSTPEVCSTFVVDNKTLGPKYFDSYFDAVDWMKEQIKMYM